MRVKNEEVLKARVAAKLTQKEAAGLIGISPATFAKWEKNPTKEAGFKASRFVRLMRVPNRLALEALVLRTLHNLSDNIAIGTEIVPLHVLAEKVGELMPAPEHGASDTRGAHAWVTILTMNESGRLVGARKSQLKQPAPPKTRAPKEESIFLQNVSHAYRQTDGSYAWPNSREGDMLRQAKREIEALLEVES